MAKAKVTKVKALDEAKEESVVKTSVKTTVRRKTLTRGAALREELVLGTLLAELLGVFVLTSVALAVNNSFVIVAFAFMFLVMILGRLSGGHINPVVTIALLATRKISAIKAGGYIVAQVLGAMLALVVVTQFINSSPADAAQLGQQPAVYEATPLNGQWRPFFAEGLAALVLAFGALAARDGRRENLEAGFIAGGSVFLALVIAFLGSASIVNPAAAFGLSAYKFDNMWTLWAYAAAPLIGAVAGAWLYRLMKWDMNGARED